MGIRLSSTEEEIEIDGQKKLYTSIAVADNGPGIPEKFLKRIFDPFFTTKDPGEGTGLGLAICYGIVTELNGRIEVDSTKGEGTCFTIQIPSATESSLNASA